MTGFVFSEKPIRIEEGDGVFLYDGSDTEYLDMGASYACVPLGHGHPAVHEAVTEQFEKLTYVQASYPNAARCRRGTRTAPSARRWDRTPARRSVSRTAR